MHANFNPVHGTSEKNLIALANAQAATYKVSVLICADCDRPPMLSVVDFFDPRVEIVRIPKKFMAYFTNYHIFRLNPFIFHAHCDDSKNLRIWVKPWIKRRVSGINLSIQLAD